MALAVVVVGERFVAWRAIDFTLALRASSAVTISRLTATAIAAPTPAAAPTDLPSAVVVIVDASLAPMSSAPGTTSVVGPDRTSASVWFPEKATETAAAAEAAGMSAPALLDRGDLVSAVGLDGDRALAGDRGGADGRFALVQRGVRRDRGAEADRWVCRFGQGSRQVSGHVGRLHREQSAADCERSAVGDCRHALAGAHVDRERRRRRRWSPGRLPTLRWTGRCWSRCRSFPSAR